MLAEALKFIKKGLAVVPLKPGVKFPPAKSNYYEEPIDTEEKAIAWWSKRPTDGIGIIIGEKYGIVGVDVDINHGASPELIKSFPRTVTTKSRNGYHLFYKHRKGIENKPLLPVEPGKAWNQAPAYLYTKGRYFVAPGTVITHQEDEKGNLVPVTPYEYAFFEDAGGALSFDEITPADIPESWLTPTPKNSAQVQGKYGQNSRHAMLVRTATAMRRRGCSAEHIEAELLKRNEKDCDPPKAPKVIETEAKNLATWAIANVQVSPTASTATADEYIVPVGFSGDTFYFTSSRNRQIVGIPSTGLTPNKLLSLMPLEYWQMRFPKTNKDGEVSGINWLVAASDLLETCLDAGIFDERKIRGAGCWQDAGRLIIHTGEELIIDGREVPINHLESRFIYPLSPAYPIPQLPALSIAECEALIKACAAPTWQDASSSYFLAGAMALLRISGALPWRPHTWLTGSKGTGKTTLIERVVKIIAGDHGLHVYGDTTSAGIRQALGGSSRPVVFDEGETEDRKSDARMKQVVHFFRQSSSETDALIVKGTPDGSGLQFKASSMGIISSIRVNLTEEADLSRFTVLELDKHDAGRKVEFLRALDPITATYAERLFARAIKLYPVLLQSIQIFEDVVSERSDRRTGQQYGALLAGYWMLVSDAVVDRQAATELISQIPRFGTQNTLIDYVSDEMECLNHLLTTNLRWNDETHNLSYWIELASKSTLSNDALVNSGMDADAEWLYIQSSHTELSKIFRDTAWQNKWNNTLRRLPGAISSVQHKFENRNLRCVKIPIATLFPQK